MHDFNAIIKLISLKKNIYYSAYKVEKNRLILIKSPLSRSSSLEVREVVQIYTLLQEYNYSCTLLDNNNLEIIKE